MNDSIGVYKISSPSGACYVGMTMTGFQYRWNGHLKELRNGRHKCLGLKRAYSKYGEENLKFEILETFPLETEQSLVLLRERDWWDKLKSEGLNIYNGRPTGTGSVFHTAESRLNISHSMKKIYEDSLDEKALKLCENINCKVLMKLKPSSKKKFCSRFCLAEFRANIFIQTNFLLNKEDKWSNSDKSLLMKKLKMNLDRDRKLEESYESFYKISGETILKRLKERENIYSIYLDYPSYFKEILILAVEHNISIVTLDINSSAAKDIIDSLYNGDQLSGNEVGLFFSCSGQTVRNKMKNLNIDRRPERYVPRRNLR